MKYTDDQVKNMIRKNLKEEYEEDYGPLSLDMYKIFKEACYDNIMPFDASKNIGKFMDLMEEYSSHRQSYLENYFNDDWNEYLEYKKKEEFEANEYLGDRKK
jgi:hypothetical protein